MHIFYGLYKPICGEDVLVRSRHLCILIGSVGISPFSAKEIPKLNDRYRKAAPQKAVFLYLVGVYAFLMGFLFPGFAIRHDAPKVYLPLWPDASDNGAD